jgi:hypothetical protein
MVLIFLVLFCLVLVVWPGLCISRIAEKTGTEPRWIAWVPVASMYLVCKIGGKSGWWVLACFIPYIGSFIALYLLLQLPKALGVQSAAKYLIIIPVVNFFYLGHLAFREEPADLGLEETV